MVCKANNPFFCQRLKCFNNSIQHYPFVCTQLNDSNHCYVNYQFNLTSVICLRTVKWSNNSFWPTDMTLLGTTNPGQSGLESNAMKKFSAFRKAPGLEIYHQVQFRLIYMTLVGFYPSADMQSVYSIAPTDLAGTPNWYKQTESRWTWE